MTLLRPIYRNLSKRLVKSPRLYFLDTAIALVLEDGVHVEGIELKASKTPSPHWAEPLRQFADLVPGVGSLSVRAPVERESLLTADIHLRPWHQW